MRKNRNAYNKQILDYIEGLLTEERTDEALDLLEYQLRGSMPWWIPSFVVRNVLDAVLPEHLITLLRVVLD